MSKKKHTKLIITLTSVASLVTLLLGTAIFTPMETLIIKSCNMESNKVEQILAQWALFTFHGRKTEIEKLQKTRGLNFIVSYPSQRSRAILSWLLDKGADINTISPNDGLPPLHAAIVQGKSELVTLLVQRGADLTIKEVKKGMTARELLEMLEPETERELYFSMMESLCYND